jgi:hypothetical protein
VVRQLARGSDSWQEDLICRLDTATQVQAITQAVTPLLRTFTVGVLGNPFSYEALQNFTASPTAQTLLGGLRNATDLGLPELQRLLVGHACAPSCDDPPARFCNAQADQPTICMLGGLRESNKSVPVCLPTWLTHTFRL